MAETVKKRLRVSLKVGDWISVTSSYFQEEEEDCSTDKFYGKVKTVLSAELYGKNGKLMASYQLSSMTNWN